MGGPGSTVRECGGVGGSRTFEAGEGRVLQLERLAARARLGTEWVETIGIQFYDRNENWCG